MAFVLVLAVVTMATAAAATAGTGGGGGSGTHQPRVSITACPLRPFFLETAGEPPIGWQVWLPMFKDHMVAYGQDELAEARRIAILKSSLGAEGYRICLSLCADGGLSYDDVLARLSNRFAPKVSNVFARSVFHRRAQMQGESCVQFVTAIRALMAKCEYQEGFQAELLRDRFIAGCASEKIREKLLLEPDTLTLEQALVIANNCERVSLECKSVVTGAQVDDNAVMQVAANFRKRSTSAGKGGACFACGRTGHRKGDAKCPAVGRQCNVCHGLDHFAVCCKQRRDSARPGRNAAGARASSSGSSVKVGMIQAVVDVLRKRCGKSKAAECVINGASVCLLCDTGARVSLLNKSTADRLQLVVSDEQMALTTYTGENVHVVGMAHANVECEGRRVEAYPFVIVRNGANVMGLDLYESLGYKLGISSCHDVDACMQCECRLVESSAGGTVAQHRFRSEFAELFQQPETLLGFEHRPKVDSTVVPRSQALRRVPIALQEEVSKELGRMVSEGILEPIDASEWVSNMVVVRKPTGGVRICCDLSEVNKAVVADKYPLPTIEDLSRDMAGARFFSKLDLKWGYLQVPLDPECRSITAMITPVGLFQWTRLPPGLCSAPSCFQKILSIILKGCTGTVNLLDDILVCGRSQREHDERLHDVLCRLRTARVRLHGDKTVFSVPELDFVGLHVSAKGVSPLQSNVEAVQQIPQPTNVRLLRSFMGSVGFYMRFIPEFAATAEPLYELLRSSTPWRWTPQCTEAFEALKHALTSEPVLVHFDPAAETVVDCDASQAALGCVLLQVRDGVERPVAFASRVLHDAELNYSVSEKEALACIYACEHWHYYLYGRKFKLRTDHRALTVLLNCAGAGRKPLRLQRWHDRLYWYSFVVEYKPGSTNCMADMLSRSPVNSLFAEEELDVLSIFGNANVALLSEQEIAAATVTDLELCEVVTCIKQGWPKQDKVSAQIKPYYAERDVLSVYRGCVLRNDTVVIPVALRDRVVTLAHEGHAGVSRTLQRLREAAWWPGVTSFVRNKVASCVACSENCDNNVTRSTPLIPVAWPTEAWSKIGIDIVGEFSDVPFSKRFAITVIDYHSRWPEVHFCGTVTSQVVIRFLTELFSRWGIPKVLVSDNGVQFVSAEFEQFLAQCDIEHVKTSLYFPQSNGLVERFNRSVKQAVRTSLAEGKPVDTGVRDMLVTYRSTAQPATGVSPAQLMLGRQMRVPVNSFAVHPKTKAVRFADDNVNDIKGHVEQHQQKMAEQFNRRHRVCKPRFRVGDWVRIRAPRRRHKTDAAFTEPHRIVKMVAPFTVLIDNGTRWHMSKLKLCDIPTHANESDIVPADEDQEQASDELPATVNAPLGSHDALAFKEDDGVQVPVRHQQLPGVHPRQSARQRSSPVWHKDFVMN